MAIVSSARERQDLTEPQPAVTGTAGAREVASHRIGVNAGARLHHLPEQRCINDAGENAVEHGLVWWASGWGQIVLGRVGVVVA
jgi:hypothetical protein